MEPSLGDIGMRVSNVGKGPGKRLNKCNQCDYSSFRTGHFKVHLKIHSGEKQINATNVTMPSLTKAL